MSEEAKKILAKIIHREEPHASLEEIMEAINEEDDKWKEPWVDAALEAMESYAREYHQKEMHRELEEELNALLNKALVGKNRLKGIVSSNDIAEFISTHLKEQKQDKG